MPSAGSLCPFIPSLLCHREGLSLLAIPPGHPSPSPVFPCFSPKLSPFSFAQASPPVSNPPVFMTNVSLSMARWYLKYLQSLYSPCILILHTVLRSAGVYWVSSHHYVFFPHSLLFLAFSWLLTKIIVLAEVQDRASLVCLAQGLLSLSNTAKYNIDCIAQAPVEHAVRTPVGLRSGRYHPFCLLSPASLPSSQGTEEFDHRIVEP